MRKTARSLAVAAPWGHQMSALAYFITFSTYGSWLHGDERGSVDEEHNIYGEPWRQQSAALNRSESVQMRDPAYRLDAERRPIVMEAIRQHAAYRGWRLFAVHVRSNHVHLVVAGEQTPERMMTEFKSYASRALNEANLDEPHRKRWTRHGSTRHLFTDDSVGEAVHYVVHRQGAPMSVFVHEEFRE